MLACLALLVATSSARATMVVNVIAPKRENLQYLSFWVAKGAGLLEAEGIDAQLMPPAGGDTSSEMLRRGDAQVALLPPTRYIPLIAQKFPLIVAANLLENDGINLIVRRSVLEARHLTPSMPLVDRLKGVKGLKIGVAHGPPTRLRALYASQGLNADDYLELVMLKGDPQNEAFGQKDVDALYAHSPYAERALVEQDGIVLVNQSAGEVPELAHRAMFALCATRAFATAEPAALAAIVRAIGRAEELTHKDPKGAVDAVLRVFPSMDRRLVEALVTLYEPAVPKTPTVTAEAIVASAKLLPETMERPDLSAIDLQDYIAGIPRVAAAAAPAATPARLAVAPRAAIVLLVLVGVACAFVFFRRSRGTSKKEIEP